MRSDTVIGLSLDYWTLSRIFWCPAARIRGAIVIYYMVLTQGCFTCNVLPTCALVPDQINSGQVGSTSQVGAGTWVGVQSTACCCFEVRMCRLPETPLVHTRLVHGISVPLLVIPHRIQCIMFSVCCRQHASGASTTAAGPAPSPQH